MDSDARLPNVINVGIQAISAELARAGGVLRVDRGDRMSVLRAAATGGLRRVLPGVYAEARLAGDFEARVRALHLVDPNAVLLGRTAAAASWWPGLAVPTVQAWRRGHRLAPPGFHWSQQQIHPDDVWETPRGLRFTSPARTVLDLIDELGGQAIDEALRRRAVTLSQLEAALARSPNRPGNKLRRWLLDDSRDEPWSEAERHFHRLLRGLRLPCPYATNHRVDTAEGHRFVDVGLPAIRLAFEVDGRSFHEGAAAFVGDRRRDLQLSLAGWHVHRIAAVTIADEPDWVRQVVHSLAWERARSVA